jgi:hypothetical protein
MAKEKPDGIMYQFSNIKDWLLDGLTTSAYWNKFTFSYAVRKMCAIYFMVHGTGPMSVLNLEEELQKLVNELQRNRLNQRIEF